MKILNKKIAAKKSSAAWVQRQAADPYVARAHKDGYRARAAYKLIEINDKYNADNIQVFVKRGKSGNIEKLKSDKKGEYKYTISNIRTNIYITVEGIEEENPTGIEGITGVKVYTQDGSLFVYTPKQEKVMIISMGGAIVKDESQVGLKQYTGLQRGIYIICIGEEKIKMKI